jgi:F-type H+-transporting ATPase subunit epsilon
MARSQFPVRVLTPEGQVFDGEVEMISTRTGTGSLGVLAHHAPLMAMLEPTELKLYKSGSENPGSGDAERFAQGEGYLQVIENSALLIVEDALRVDELDRADLEARRDDARKGLESAEGGSEEENRCRRELKRAEAFLAIEA